MKIISHRGNLEGSDPKTENTVEQINRAVNFGFYVEIDVWKVDNKFYLGHDEPNELIDKFYLFNNKFYVHCKNLDAFEELSRYSQVHCFYHEHDLIVFTSKKEKIYHSNATSFATFNNEDKCIFVDLHNEISSSVYDKIYGICTDYPLILREIYQKADHRGDIRNVKYPFDLLVLDIDGVLTDGTKSYDIDGNILSKKYCDKDFTAIKRFIASGIKVCFLSGDKRVNEQMAKSRGIDFYFSRDETGNIDKSRFIPTFRKIYGENIKIAYVGDDYYDLTMLESLEYSYCPSDANDDVKKVVYKVLNTKGGDGVVAELYDLYKDLYVTTFPYDSYKVNPK